MPNPNDNVGVTISRVCLLKKGKDEEAFTPAFLRRFSTGRSTRSSHSTQTSHSDSASSEKSSRRDGKRRKGRRKQTRPPLAQGRAEARRVRPECMANAASKCPCSPAEPGLSGRFGGRGPKTIRTRVASFRQDSMIPGMTYSQSTRLRKFPIFCSISSHSASGSEPRTMPAPE